MVAARPHHQSAFTLVEMAIVIVIIGLLVGGVTMGQNLIRNADLQTVITDATKYKAAAKQFSEKYMALPGDFSEAIAQWGDDVTNCTDGNGANNGNPGTCNGDGDGWIENAAAASQTGENVQFWKQLQLGGYIDGTFSGLVGSGSTYHNTAGVNSPKGKITNTGWSVHFPTHTVWGNAEWFTVLHMNSLTFGAVTAASLNYGAALKPEEAWGIDTKMDDGKPGTGDVMAFWNGGCTTATATTDNLTAEYDLDNTAVACRLEFPRAF